MHDGETIGPGPGPANQGPAAIPAAGRAPRRLLVVTTVAATMHFLLPFARHYREKGWRVEAAGSGVPDDAAVASAFDGVHDLPLSRSVRRLGLNARGVLAIRRLIRETRPDLLHVHTPVAAFATRLAVRLMPRRERPPIVYTAHGFHFSEGGNPLVNAAFLGAELVAGRWTDRLIVINEEDAAAARRWHVVRRRQLVHMPGIGVDLAHYARAAVADGAISAARLVAGIPPDVAFVIMVAEFSARKRHRDMIRAFAAVEDRRAHLVLAGQGPLQPQVAALATRLDVSDRVHFVGFVPDVRPLIAASSVLVLPSSREGLARCVMEALALEVPAIVSTARGNLELIGDDAGILVPIGDVVGLTAALDSVLADPVRAAAMGRCGRERVRRLFDLEIVLSMHDELYEDLLRAR